MKNLKNYFTLFACLLFFSCSNDNTNIDNQGAENSIAKANFTKPSGICGYIQDADPNIVTLSPATLLNLCGPDAEAFINEATSTNYKFISNGLLTAGNWQVLTGDITFNGGSKTASGSAVTLLFSSCFTTGTIRVDGLDSTGQGTGPILKITKNGYVNCGALPVLKMKYINNNGGIALSTKGEFWFESPTSCEYDWSTISSITLQLGGTYFGNGSNSNVAIGILSYNNWLNTASSPSYKNIRVLTNNNTTSPVPAPGGLFTYPNHPGAAIEGWATITFNNGCPTQTINAVYPNVE